MKTDYYNLKDKNVLITGGTTGIGLATAKLLVEAGANVMIFSRNKAHLDDALFCLKNGTGKVFGINGDVSNKEEVMHIFNKFDEIFGGIEILINNAALPARSITDSNYLDWNYIFNVNIIGYMLCAKESIKRMKPKNEGHIINIGSMSAKVREEDADVYVATKSAVDGFSDSLRKKINKFGIKVSLIQPGSVGTGMVSEDLNEQKNLQREMKMLKAEDVAEAIIFCLTRPKGCEVTTIEIKPHKQYI